MSRSPRWLRTSEPHRHPGGRVQRRKVVDTAPLTGEGHVRRRLADREPLDGSVTLVATHCPANGLAGCPVQVGQPREPVAAQHGIAGGGALRPLPRSRRLGRGIGSRLHAAALDPSGTQVSPRAGTGRQRARGERDDVATDGFADRADRRRAARRSAPCGASSCCSGCRARGPPRRRCRSRGRSPTSGTTRPNRSGRPRSADRSESLTSSVRRVGSTESRIRSRRSSSWRTNGRAVISPMASDSRALRWLAARPSASPATVPIAACTSHLATLGQRRPPPVHPVRQLPDLVDTGRRHDRDRLDTPRPRQRAGG